MQVKTTLGPLQVSEHSPTSVANGAVYFVEFKTKKSISVEAFQPGSTRDVAICDIMTGERVQGTARCIDDSFISRFNKLERSHDKLQRSYGEVISRLNKRDRDYDELRSRLNKRERDYDELRQDHDDLDASFHDVTCFGMFLGLALMGFALWVGATGNVIVIR